MKKIMPILVMVFLLSSMLMGCGTVKEEVMKTFKSEEGRFSIDFPGEAKHEVQTAQTAVGNININLYLVEKDDSAYICGYNDYPEAVVKNSNTNDILVNAANGAIQNINGKNEVIKDITLDKYPGKDIICEAEKEGITFKMHQKIYLVGNRLYQVNVSTNEEEKNKETINKFLDSFKLINQ